IADFVRIAGDLFRSDKLPPAARASAPQVFARLQTPSDDGKRLALRFPACEWLDPALESVARANPTFATVAQLIKSLEPDVGWSRR
ncbi:dimethylsulfonioproprionate lyase family protein, partial [Burkholderia sp. SIMBA_013]